MMGGDPPLPPPSRAPYQPWQGRPYRRRGAAPPGPRNGWVPRRQRSPPPPPALRQRHSRPAPPHHQRHAPHPQIHSPLHSAAYHHGPPPPLSRSLQGRLRTPPRSPPHRSDLPPHRAEQPPYRGEPGPPHRIDPPDHALYRPPDHGPRTLPPKPRGDPPPFRSDHTSHRGPPDHSSHVPYRGEPGPLYRADMVSHRDDSDLRRSAPDISSLRADSHSSYNSWFRPTSKIHKPVRQKKRRPLHNGGPLSRMPVQQSKPDSPILSRVGPPLPNERGMPSSRSDKLPLSCAGGKLVNASAIPSTSKPHFDNQTVPFKPLSNASNAPHAPPRRPPAGLQRALSSGLKQSPTQKSFPVNRVKTIARDDVSKDKSRPDNHEAPKNGIRSVEKAAEKNSLSPGTRIQTPNETAKREKDSKPSADARTPKATTDPARANIDAPSVRPNEPVKKHEADHNVSYARSTVLRSMETTVTVSNEAEIVTVVQDSERVQLDAIPQFSELGRGGKKSLDSTHAVNHVLFKSMSPEIEEPGLSNSVRGTSTSSNALPPSGTKSRERRETVKEPGTPNALRLSSETVKPLVEKNGQHAVTAAPKKCTETKATDKETRSASNDVLELDQPRLREMLSIVNAKPSPDIPNASANDSVKHNSLKLTDDAKELKMKKNSTRESVSGNFAKGTELAVSSGSDFSVQPKLEAVKETSVEKDGVAQKEQQQRNESDLSKGSKGCNSGAELDLATASSLPNFYINITDINPQEEVSGIGNVSSGALSDQGHMEEAHDLPEDVPPTSPLPDDSKPSEPKLEAFPEHSCDDLPASNVASRSAPVIPSMANVPTVSGPIPLRSTPLAAVVPNVVSSKPVPIAVPAPALSFLRSSPRSRARVGSQELKFNNFSSPAASSTTFPPLQNAGKAPSNPAPTRSGTNDLVDKIHQVDAKITALERVLALKRAEKERKDGALSSNAQCADERSSKGGAHAASELALQVSLRAPSVPKRQRCLNPMQANLHLVMTQNHAKANAAAAALRSLCSDTEFGLDAAKSGTPISAEVAPEVMKKITEKIAEQKADTSKRKRLVMREYKSRMESWQRKMKAAKDRRSKEVRDGTRERDRFLLLSTKGHMALLTSRTSSGRTSTKVIPSVGVNGQMNGIAELDALLTEIETEGGTPGSKANWARTLADIPEQDPTRVPHDCGSVLVEDPVAAHHASRCVNPWRLSERLIFIDKYLMYPKNFRKIAGFLEHKSVRECSSFYYENKLELGLKQLLKEATTMKRKGVLKAHIVALAKKKLTHSLDDSLDALPTHTSGSSVLNVPFTSLAGRGPAELNAAGSLGVASVVKSIHEGSGEVSLPLSIKPTERIMCELNLIDLEGINASKFVQAISNFGTDWREVSLFMSLPGKTSTHYREFYRRNKGNLGLDTRAKVRVLSAMTSSRSRAPPSKMSPRLSPRRVPKPARVGSRGSPKVSMKSTKGQSKLSPKLPPKGSAKSQVRKESVETDVHGSLHTLEYNHSRSPDSEGPESLSIGSEAEHLSLKRRKSRSPAAKTRAGSGQPSSSDANSIEGGSETGRRKGEGDGRKSKPKVTWTAAEGIEFRRLFKIHGRNWKKLSQCLAPKTPAQIKGFWRRIADEVGDGYAVDSEKGGKAGKKRVKNVQDGASGEQGANCNDDGQQSSPKHIGGELNQTRKRSPSIAQLDHNKRVTKKEKRNDVLDVDKKADEQKENMGVTDVAEPSVPNGNASDVKEDEIEVPVTALDKAAEKAESSNVRRLPMLRSSPSPMLRSVPVRKVVKKSADKSSGDIAGMVAFKAAENSEGTGVEKERKSLESYGILELLGKRLSDATDERMEKK